MVERLTHQFALPLVLFTLCAGTAKAEKRTWTDNSGKFSITAELVDVKDGMVMLRKAGGKTAAVPLTRLSDADRRYLQSSGHAAAEPSARDDVGEYLWYPDAMMSPPWNDANPPFDLAEFLQAPPPEKNAAPRYLEAFRHFYAMDRELFPDLSEEEQRRRSLEIWERSKEGRRLERGWKATPREFDPIATDAWLAQYEPGMQILVAAQELPECVFQTSRSIDFYAPHEQAAREVRDVIQWRVRRDLHVGDLQRPLADLNVLLRLTRDLRPRGSSGTQFSTMFLEESACRNLTPAILTAPEVTVQDCDRLLAIMIEHERGAIDMLREGVCADYIVARQTLHDLQHRVGAFDPERMKEARELEGDVQSWTACLKFFDYLTGGDVEALRSSDAVVQLQRKLLPTAVTGGKLLADQAYATDVRILNDYYAMLLTMAAKPDAQPVFERRGPAPIEIYKPLRDALLTRLIVGFLGSPPNPTPRSESLVRGAQCLAALRRWQLEHDEPPPDLETLVRAAGMDRAPTDPWTEQPLRMKTIEDESVIYSVGPDRKDGIATSGDQFSLQPSLNRRVADDDVCFVLHDDFLTHRDVIAGIEKLGGRCTVDEHRIGKPIFDVILRGDQVTDAELIMLAPLRQLQSLNLGGTQVTDAGLRELAGLTQLQSLYLNSTQVTDAGLKELAGLAQLQRLHLSRSQITDARLKELARLAPLQSLSLSECKKVTGAGLKELAGLKHLQTLNLNGTQVIDAGLIELAGLTQLQWLDLRDTKVTDAGLKELAGLTQLKTLFLSRSQITDTGLKELAGLTQMRLLDLGGAQVTDAGLKELARLTQLQSLYLGNTKVTDAGLKELAKLPDLRTLNLDGTQVTYSGLIELAGLEKLRRVDLHRTRVTGAELKKLAQNPTQKQFQPEPTVIAAWENAGAEFGLISQREALGFVRGSKGKTPAAGDVPAFRFQKFPKEGLTVLPPPEVPFGLWFRNVLNSEQLQELAGLKQLRSLSLTREYGGGPQLTDEGLRALSGLTQLQSLDLGRTKVTDAGLSELAGLTQLQLLHLDRTQVTDAGLRVVAGMTQLRSLNLGNTEVTDAGVKELAGLAQLQWLDLRETEVTDAGLKELARLKQLRLLYIADTEVTDAGVQELRNALPSLARGIFR